MLLGCLKLYNNFITNKLISKNIIVILIILYNAVFIVIRPFKLVQNVVKSLWS